MPVKATQYGITRYFTNSQWDAMDGSHNGWTLVERVDYEKPEARRPFAEITPPVVVAVGDNVTAEVVGTSPIAVDTGFGLSTVYIEDGTTDGDILQWNDSGGVWEVTAPSFTGTVTSVGLSLPTDIFDVADSPVTGAGTITVTLDNQTANTFWAGPSTGSPAAPAFRVITSADLPTGTIVLSGTDTQTIRFSGTTPTASSLLRNDGTTVAVGQAPDASYMFSVKQTGASNSTNGIAVVRSGSTALAALYHNGSATLESVGGLNLQLKTASASIINLVPGGGAGQIGQVTISPGANITSIEGNAALLRMTGTYAASGAGGDFNGINLQFGVNQSGSADQVIRGLQINPTLTSVAVDFRGIAYQPSMYKFLYQPNGTGVTSHLLGNLGIGTGTTSPGAKLDITGNGATSSTYSMRVYNSTPGIILSIRDDKRVGLLTTSPTVTLDAATATDAFAFPTGTTGQRPAVDSTGRFNSSVGGFEVRYSSVVKRLTCNTTPSAVAGAAAGTGAANPTILGNDLYHTISWTTGTSCTTGTLFTLTFNQALDASTFTFMVWKGGNSNARAEEVKMRRGSVGNTGYTFVADTALTDSTDYTIDVFVGQ